MRRREFLTGGTGLLALLMADKLARLDMGRAQPHRKPEFPSWEWEGLTDTARPGEFSGEMPIKNFAECPVVLVTPLNKLAVQIVREPENQPNQYGIVPAPCIYDQLTVWRKIEIGARVANDIVANNPLLVHRDWAWSGSGAPFLFVVTPRTGAQTMELIARQIVDELWREGWLTDEEAVSGLRKAGVLGTGGIGDLGGRSDIQFDSMRVEKE